MHLGGRCSEQRRRARVAPRAAKSIYLGFGILTVNATQRFRSGQHGAGSWYSRSEGGYLGLQSMSFPLAAQAVARGTSPSAIGRLLATNQRASFNAACKELGERTALLQRLGLPVVEASSARTGWLQRLFGK